MAKGKLTYSRINKEFPLDRLYKCQRRKPQSHTEVLFGWYLVRTSEDIVGKDAENFLEMIRGLK